MNLAALLELAQRNLSDASSRLCFADAQRLAGAGHVGHAARCALKSLSYSVGILHSAYADAWKLAGLTGSPRLPGFADFN